MRVNSPQQTHCESFYKCKHIALSCVLSLSLPPPKWEPRHLENPSRWILPHKKLMLLWQPDRRQCNWACRCSELQVASLAVKATRRLPGLSAQGMSHPDEVGVMQVGNCFDVRFCCVQVVEVAGPDMLGHLPLSLHSAALGSLPLACHAPQHERPSPSSGLRLD